MAIFENDSILAWNFANWVTVVTMALIMFFLLGMLQKFLQGKASTSADATS